MQKEAIVSSLSNKISIITGGPGTGKSTVIKGILHTYAKAHNLGVVEELCGHGIGVDMHEDPEVPNYGKRGTGPRLKEGMVICIEPMLTFGSEEIYLMDDEWTVNTIDESPAAHYEHTVLVTHDGYEILTPRLD